MIRLSLLIAALLVLPACSPADPLGRVAVSGEVTLDDQPLERGTIEFAPQQARSMQSGAAIRDGRYRIEQDQGLPPGKYTVRVFAPNTTAAASEGPPGPLGPPAARELIPARYNIQSQETLEVQGEEAVEYNLKIDSR